MFIICHHQNKKPVDRIVSDFVFLKKKNKTTMQFHRPNLRVPESDLRFLKKVSIANQTYLGA